MKNLKSSIKLLSAICFSILLGSCSDVKDSDINPEESFNRIYNSKNPEDNIYPIDIIQTDDKGYLVVSEVEERSVRLLKVDASGSAVSEALFTDLKSPMQGLYKVGEGFYFFCRDALDAAVAVKVNPDSLELVEKTALSVNYPLSVGRTSSGFIMQSWNQADKQTKVNTFNESFGSIDSTSFDIEDDVEPFLNNHLFRKGPRLPFLSGEAAANQYYINGYNNYNFNLIFLNGSLESTGEVAGYKTERYVTALQMIEANEFAVTTTATAEDKNFISSNAPINVRSQSIVSNIPAGYIPEMSLEIPLTFKRISANGAEHILCAFTTKTKQVALYSYGIESGKLNGKHILGYTNPYEVCGVTITEDGGLVVLSKTQVAGRFPRIAITKFSKAEVDQFFGR